MQDFGLISFFLWLLTIELLSFAVLPYLAWMAPNAPDRGYGFSKVCGVFAFSGICWLLTLAGLATDGNGIIYLTFVLLLIAGYRGYRPGLLSRADFTALLHKHGRAVEGVFLGLTLFYGIIRFLNPQIFWGEKPMDSTFLNFFVRNNELPPQDPWASGSPMSYYYLGIYFIAALLKLTGIPAAIGYNLAIATLGGLVGASFYGLLLLVTRNKRFSAWTAVLLVIACDPEVLRLIVFDRDPRWSWRITFDGFWASSRVFTPPGFLEYTSWSLLFADLHAHVIAIPFTATVLGLAALLFLDGKSRYSLHGFALRALLGAMLGSLFGMNTWDFITFGAAVGALLATARVPLFWQPPTYEDGTPSLGETIFVTAFSRAVAFVWDAVIVAAFAGLAVYLYNLGVSFRPNGGWGWVYDQEFNTFWKFFRVFGYWVIGTLAALGVIAFAPSSSKRRVSVWSCLFAGLLSAAVIIPPALSALKGIGHQPWGTVVYAATVVGLSYIVLWARHSSDEKKLVWIFLSVTATLVVVLEIFFLLDRMNTLFKGYMAIWMMSGLSTVVAVFYANQMLREAGRERARRALSMLVSLGVGMILVGTAFNVYAVVTIDRGLKRTYTFDGMEWMKWKREYTEDGEIARWFNDNVNGIATILEAQGDGYREFTRIAMHTGLPTVLGWEHHVRQRGLSPDEVPARKRAIYAIYTSEDMELTKKYLAKYGVDFIVVGNVEKATYRPLAASKFENHPEVFTKVATLGDSVIYRTYLSKFNPAYKSALQQ